MSVRIMGAVFGIDLEPSARFILLALADNADHDGCHAHPGVELLAWKTGYSERTVQRVLADLEERGVLVAEENATGGRGLKTDYSIHLERVNYIPKPEWSPRNGRKPKKGVTVSPFSDQKGDIDDTKRVTSTTQKGDIHDTKTGGTPFNLTVQEPSNRTVTLTPLPPTEDAAIFPPESTADEQAIRDHRDRLMDAYFEGVGIGPGSPERLARRYQAGTLTREIVCRLDTATMRGMAEYTRRDWLGAKPNPIRAIPSVDHVLRKHTEYLEAASGKTTAPVPEGRRGMGNDFLANLARGQK